MNKKLLIFLILLIPTQAWAFVYTGNDYLSRKDSSGRLSSLHYVIGMYESVSFFTDINVPEGITMGQLEAVFEKYLADNPDKRHLPAYILFLDSLKASYGIKEK